MSATVPAIEPGTDTLTAALAYAASGLYVGPVKRETKHPGSILGSSWQRLTSTDPQVIASWFAGTDHGIFIHAGRSGLVVLDVDDPTKLHTLVRRALDECAPPSQTTRQGDTERGHYLFALPRGRMLGNSLGELANGWGEIRGRNGVIIVAPSVHAAPDGLYAWRRHGAVPELPAYLAEALPDALPTAESVATSAEVQRFLDAHTDTQRPELVGIHATGWQSAVDRGESRHHTMTGHLAGAMREAAAGLIDARTAADTLESIFLDAVTKPPTGAKQGAARDRVSARDEWRGLLAWAIAQAAGADLEQVRARVAEKVPSREQENAWVRELAGEGSADLAAPTVNAETEEEVTDEPASGSSWAAVNLADTVAGVMAGTITRPAPTIGRRSDGQALFYRGKVNGVAGASNAGKSWTGFYSCAQEITDGAHVVYVDLEDDMAAAVARLLDLGVPAEVIVERFRYVSPAEAFTYAAAEAFGRLLDEVRPSLVVIDSTGESMALDGAKPNDDDDVARWFRRLPTAVARRCGAAVLVLDHVTKAEDGGLWPIGSQRKRAAIGGAQYMQVNVRPFDRTTPGYSKLVCAKDRHGNYHQGQTVALVHLTPHTGGVDLELRAPAETSGSGIGQWRPTAIMERISRALEDADEPMSVRALDRAVNGKKEHKQIATDLLVKSGHVDLAQGPRRAVLHQLVRPYRQTDDPLSDLYQGPGDSHPSNDPETPSVSVPVPRKGDGGHTLPPSPGDSRGTVGDGHTLAAVPTVRRPLPTDDEGRPLPCPECGRKPHHTVTCEWGKAS